jgi:hypothetical protein
MPELLDETMIDFKSMQSTELRLLEGNNFSQAALVEQLDIGVQLAFDASLQYSVRPLLSLQLRLAYLTRDFTKAGKVCERLDHAFGQIKVAGVTCAFFLVESRKGGTPTRNVYCCAASPTALETFISTKCTKDRFGDLPIKPCRAHVGNCLDDGVCVVPVVPLKDDPIDGEDPHCWSEFRPDFALVDLMQANPSTKNHLPHSRMVTEVDTFDFAPVDIAEIVRQGAQKSMDALDRVSGEFDVWFEMNENLQTKIAQLIGKEMPKFRMVLENTLCAPDSDNKRLELLSKIDSHSAKRIAADLVPKWNQVLRILRCTLNELPEMATYATEDLPKYFGELRNLASAYDASAMVTDDMIQSKPNLMNVKMDFEKDR